MSGSVLAVDFGSSNTAAAYQDREGRIREVRLSSTSSLMPSAVLWSRDRVVVGAAAVQAMLSDPAAFEPSPKRRLADREIFLGNAVVAVSDLVAAVLTEVFTKAQRVMGRAPSHVVLTYPDKWGAGQRAQLAEAATAAGVAVENLTLVSEATAAAQFYTATGAQLPVGSRVAVCDFGAGTVDVAVLDKQADGGFTVVVADGEEGLGGHDLDARINGWVRRQLYADDPKLAAELDEHTDVGDRLVLNDRIRAAKEALSETTSASIAVRGAAGTRVVLTRDEFDALIAPDVDRAIDVIRRVLTDAEAIRPTAGPPTIYLAGGTSAIPLIHNRLSELGTLATLGDPKTVVCEGALHTVPPSETHNRAVVSVPTLLEPTQPPSPRNPNAFVVTGPPAQPAPPVSPQLAPSYRARP